MALPALLARGALSLARVRTISGTAGAATVKGLRMSLTVNAKKAIQKLAEMDELPLEIVEEGYKVFVKETPIRSGNARRSTKLNDKKLEIDARYAYAQRLDEGWSKQSPDGMSKPAQKAMQIYAKKRAKEIDRS